MNADEVAQFFVDLKSKGTVHHFGVSNHGPSKFDLLQKRLDKISNNNIKLVTHEFEASVWNPSYLNYDSAIADHAYQNEIHPLGKLNCSEMFPLLLLNTVICVLYSLVSTCRRPNRWPQPSVCSQWNSSNEDPSYTEKCW